MTEIVEFDGPHLLPAVDGWEEIADFALDWAIEARRTDAEREIVSEPIVTDLTRATQVIR